MGVLEIRNPRVQEYARRALVLPALRDDSRHGRACLPACLSGVCVRACVQLCVRGFVRA